MPKEPRYLTAVQWSRVAALTWLDPAFKYALLSDPVNAIRDNFPDFEFDRLIRVPPKPDDLDDEQLDAIVNGDQEAVVIPYYTPCC